jgi:tetratricopeptide (TPR) repeat protein
MISELQIEKTRQHAGRGANSKTVEPQPKSAPPPRTEAAPVEQTSHREIQLTRRQQLEQTIANNPADLEAYGELAQVHIDEHRLGEAVHLLHKALQASGNDVGIQERLEDVEILRKKEQLSIAESRAAKRPDDQEANALVEQLQDELHRFDWEVFYRRSQRYPEDRELRFQLGLRLKRLGKHREAVACFEDAVQLPSREAGALLELGECWQRQKQYSKSLDYYRRSVEACMDELTELKKLALYRAGVLAMGLRDLNTAEQFLQSAAEVDPGYRDVAARLDKIRDIRDKG